jgi:hypothetical protein
MVTVWKRDGNANGTTLKFLLYLLERIIKRINDRDVKFVGLIFDGFSALSTIQLVQISLT